MGAGDLLHCIQTDSGVHPASYSMGTGALSPGVKQPGHEADHSPLPSDEVKNAWCYTSTHPVCLHGLLKAQGQLYLFYLLHECPVQQ